MTIIKNLVSRLKRLVRILPIVIAVGLAGCDGASDQNSEASTGADYKRGPNNGRLLEEGPFALEITIFEAGVPPQFHVYPYIDGEPVEASKVGLTIELERLDGQVDHFAFKPERDYLASDNVVVEPHSFDVRVSALYDGQSYSWAYPSYEGRTTISTQAALNAGIKVEPAGPAVIEETIDVLGRISLAPGAEARLRARFPGQVLAVYKATGDSVKAGEKLARIESNESLQRYDIISPIAGVVFERHTNVGDIADEGLLFVVGDATKLHADFHIFPKDHHRVAPGQGVIMRSADGHLATSVQIETFLPANEPETQTVIARAFLSNPDKKWIPGMTVQGDITVGKKEVPLAVRTAALQRFRDFTVVFARVDETYEVRMLEIGRQTPEWTEVLGGISPGQDYVVENSFLIKADIEKSGASHDH